MEEKGCLLFEALLQPCATKKLSLRSGPRSSKKKEITNRHQSPHFSAQIDSLELDPFLNWPVSSSKLGGFEKSDDNRPSLQA